MRNSRAGRDTPHERAPRRARVWAVGGGKGGVGKSILTSSLALSVAKSGQRCVLVDADLGGANLHTLIGGRAPNLTLGQFLSREVAELADVMTETRFPNLSLISGTRVSLEIANLKHQQKAKLLRHIERLPVDHVFLDLSAGSAFNALDFFLAGRGIAVVVPEPTAIENTYHFLKAAYFRSLRKVARREEVREAIEKTLAATGVGRGGSPLELIEAVEALEPAAGRLLRRAAERFAPLVVVNQARTHAHRSLGREIALAAHRHLGTTVEYLGALERDECVRDAVRQGVPVLDRYPGCPFSQDLAAIGARLLDDRADVAVPGPAPQTRRTRRGPDPLVVRGLEGEPDPSGRGRSLPAARPAPAASWTSRRSATHPPDPSTPGAYLRHRREHLGLALVDLVRRTRIHHLERLEDEHFDALPPEPYVRGYVLQYARILGIRQAEALAARFVERYRQALATR